MASTSYVEGLDYSQYNQQHGITGPWLATSSYRPVDEFSASSQNVETASKTAFEPLIYENGSGYEAGPGRSSAIQTSFVYNWWLCILSVVVSILAMVAIVVLLAIADGSSLPRLPLSITVNTYVSFFATIAKAAMLVPVAESISQLKWLWFRQARKLEDIQIFDDASRGPLGSIRLILRMKAIQFVAVGGLITVLSMVLDPFIQQIVSYPARSIEVGSASIGRAQAYDANLWIAILDGGLLTGPDFGMKSAVYNGIFAPAAAKDLEPACPTGNCTFPLFDSLAFCSRCADVSNDVVNNDIKNDPANLQGDYNISYTLPGNAVVEFGVFFSGGDLAMGPAMVSTTALPPDLSQTMLGLQDPLLTLAVLQFPEVGTDLSQGNYYNTLPTTHECALYFCVNTYNVTVENSVPNTTIVASWTSETGTPTVGGVEGAAVYMGDTVDAVLERPSDGVDGNHTYWIPAGTLANLKAWLNVTLQGSLNTTGSEVDGSNGPVWANDVMEAFNVTSDWDALMNGLATSMTTYIRSSGPSYALETAEGIAHKNETYVHVKWPWLTFPVGLVLFSILFLITTMIINSRRKALAWKSSSLALLFHGLESSEARHAPEGLGQMEEMARRTRVRLEMVGNGEWKLVHVG